MYRKGVSALVINDQEEFLLVNLESFEERYFAVPGGGVDEGESLEGAVYRELCEELTLPKESLVLIGKSDIPVRVTYKKIKLTREGKEYIGFDRYFFGFRFLRDMQSIQPKDGEVRTYKWVPYAKLGNYLLFDNQLDETSEKIHEIFKGVFLGK